MTTKTETHRFSAVKGVGFAAAALFAASSAANAASVGATFSSKNVLQGNFEDGVTADTFLTNNSNATGSFCFF